MTQNYSLEGDLSPNSLRKYLPITDIPKNSSDFLDSFAGRKALSTLLHGFYLSTNDTLSGYACAPDSDDDIVSDYREQSCGEFKEYRKEILFLAYRLLEIDYQDVPEPKPENISENRTFLDFWANTIAGKEVPKDAETRKNIFMATEDESLFGKLKSQFDKFVDSWRGYSDMEKIYSKSDKAFRAFLQNKHDTSKYTKSFSNVGVKSMKVKRTVRKTFSNDVACDMLANKLTKDWFICEPECQPLIAEQLKAACVPAATFAPALKCNVMQYDGEAKVSAKELAALDKVQQFVQALKDEIACGNDCGGIEMVPASKAFALKRQLKKQLKNFADEGEIELEEISTPNELIEAEAAGIDVDHPEMYEEFVDKVEAGKVSPEAMGIAPAITAPTSVDPASMGHAYDDLVDSTIADNGGIMQEDMSGYDAAPGDLSLSAAPVGDAMAQAQADAIIWDDADEAAPMKAVAPVAPMANPQAFSRTLRRRQAGATAKNFANVRKPEQKKVQPQAAQSMKGLYRLLGDKYIK